MISTTNRSLRTDAGFTLLEILIAVTLVAMMAVGLWSVFAVSLRSWTRGMEYIDKNQRHRSILDMVHKQMASAYGIYTRSDQESDGNPRLIFLGSRSSVLFVSLNSLRFHESPGLTLVSCEVAGDSFGQYSLVEKEARYLGRLPDEELQATQSTSISIFENLQSCVFEYFDPGAGGSPPRWVTEWDADQLRRLPAAVSITLVSRDPRGNTHSRHMVIPVQAKPQDFRVNIVNPFGGRVAVIQ